MSSDLIETIGALLPFIVIFTVSFLLFVYNKKKKKEALNQLPGEHQKLEHQKRDADIVNTFTVILPLVIFIVLRNQGVLWTQAMFTGLFVGIVFKSIFFLSQRKNNYK